MPEGARPRADWEGSISAAVSDALAPLLSGPALAPAIVWAGFALLLPFVVRGRWMAVDLFGAALWVCALIAAHVALGDLLATTTELSTARGAVAGSLGAAVLVLAAAQMHSTDAAWRPRPVTTA